MQTCGQGCSSASFTMAYCSTVLAKHACDCVRCLGLVGVPAFKSLKGTGTSERCTYYCSQALGGGHPMRMW